MVIETDFRERKVNGMPRLSIIIPTFNSREKIESCLQSVGAQTFCDYEVLIQDGGSSDDTLEKAARFRGGDGTAELKITAEKDKGPYDAMNKAVRRASGEWLYFLGSDDELHDRGVLTAVFERAEFAKADVVYGSVKIVGDVSWAKDGSTYDGPFELEKLLSKNICHQAIFYRSEFHRSVGEYNTDYAVCADWDFNMRCWSRRPFTYADAIIAKFSAGGISTRQLDDRFGTDFVSNVVRHFDLSVYDPLINTPAFQGFDQVRRIQRSRTFVGRVVRRIRAAVAKR